MHESFLTAPDGDKLIVFKTSESLYKTLNNKQIKCQSKTNNGCLSVENLSLKCISCFKNLTLLPSLLLPCCWKIKSEIFNNSQANGA